MLAGYGAMLAVPSWQPMHWSEVMNCGGPFFMAMTWSHVSPGRGRNSRLSPVFHHGARIFSSSLSIGASARIGAPPLLSILALWLSARVGVGLAIDSMTLRYVMVFVPSTLRIVE